MSNNKKDIPVVDEDRVKSIFSRLERMDVQLDQDPLQYGPKRLNGKVATARQMASECERIYMSVSKDLQLLKSLHRQAELDFNLQMQYLLTTDAEVRSNRNIRDRDAAATMKLRDEKEAIDEMEVAIQDLVMVMSVVKAKRADLKDIQGRLRDQMKLCQEELGLGAHWGSKPAPGSYTPDIDAAPKTAKSVLDQFNDLLIEDEEINVEQGDESLMAETDDEAPEALPGEDTDTSDEDVDALLQAVDDNAAANIDTSSKASMEPEDEDLDDVIGSLTGSEEKVEVAPEPEDDGSGEVSHTEDVEDHDEDVEDSGAVVDVFASDDSEESKDPTDDLGNLNSDADVEAFFDNLASAEPSAAEDEDIDLDELVGMLG